MRLTNDNYDNDALHLKHKTQWKYNNELWQYVKEREDIEEELGISIKDFIKIFLNGVFVKLDDDIKDYTHSIGWLWDFSRNDNFVDTERPLEYHFDIVTGRVHKFYLKDYGKTWAFTKEELE